MQDKFVETAYGRIHYVEGGEGEPVLLAHSGGTSVHEWDANFARLSRRGRVIAWDTPGHGDSGPLNGHMSIEDYAKSTVSLLDALGIEKAHFVGSSLGGFIAVAMGASHAQRLKKLVIVDIQLRPKSWWVENWPMVEGMFTEVVQPFLTVAPRFKALSASTFRRWNIDRTKAGARTMMDVIWAARDYDVITEITKVKCPAMTVLGGVGPAIDCVEDFRRLLPHGRLEIMKGCGHFPMIDEPEIFDDLLTDFLELRKA